MVEVQHTEALCPQAIADRFASSSLPATPPASSSRSFLSRPRPTSGSAPQTFTSGSAKPACAASFTAVAIPLNKTAAAYRRDHQFDSRQLLHDLEPARRLSRDDLPCVVRRNHRIPIRRNQFFRPQPSLRGSRPHLNNLRAQRPCCSLLHLGSVVWHHDYRLRPQRPRGIGDTLRVGCRWST